MERARYDCFVSPGGRTVCFWFPGGNETPGFPTFLTGFVSSPPPKVGAPQEIGLKISVDHCSVGAITEILIEIKVLVKTHGDMGIQYNYSIFASYQCLPIPPATLHVRKR